MKPNFTFILFLTSYLNYLHFHQMRKISILFLCILIYCNKNVKAQTYQPKPLSELIKTSESAWTSYLELWIKESTNFVEVLPKDSLQADSILYKSQVATRSTMGSIVYETGGILIGHGWIRILGSGSERMKRNLMDWNVGKTYTNFGDQLPYLLIADDILGGFFAVNAGGLDSVGLGMVYYFAPDLLIWSNLNLSYSEFIQFCFFGDIKNFYTNLYWIDWEDEIKTISGDQGIHCFPYLCTIEGQDINKVSRGIVPIEELWILHNALRTTLVTGDN